MTQYFRRDLQVALGWTAPHFKADFAELKVSMANIDVEIYYAAYADVDKYFTRDTADPFSKDTMSWNVLEPSKTQKQKGR
jgi:hypothetical protein